MNEVSLIITAVVCTAFVLLAWRVHQERLVGVITLFLILIATVGGKIVLIAGHLTNTGSIFYAAAFLATYFLIERYGRREGVQAIWIGIIGVLFYVMLASITVTLQGAAMTAQLNDALAIAFGTLPRVGIASLLAYVLSQTLNVYLYLHLRDRTSGRWLWLRANVTNVLAQLLDSLVFVTVAFAGVVAPLDVWNIIVSGFVIKVVYMMVASPLLYINKIQEE